MTDWQPIETAPKDREILAWSKLNGFVVVEWDNSETEEARLFQWAAIDCGFKERAFTHWMPLPEPPGEQK